MNYTAEKIKETGATFTPTLLADFLSKRILDFLNVEHPVVLDPSCGDGSLLSSIGSLLDNEGNQYTLQGYDLDPTYLREAEERLRQRCQGPFELRQADFLDEIEITKNQAEIGFEEKAGLSQFADVVIANPPYVRTQVLGAARAQELAAKFNLSGRVDLYYPFLISMTHALKFGGIIGVITSNRFLFTKSGDSIRRFLYENFEILEVIDLGDTKLFDAAVLPAILVGRRKKNAHNKEAKFTKVYEALEFVEEDATSVSSVYDILSDTRDGYFSVSDKLFKKTSGALRFRNSKENTWAMLSVSEKKWVDRVEKKSSSLVGDHFKVRVGIKTTADKVFIGDSWEQLGDLQPEAELMHDLISQENLKQWKLSEDKKLRVLYTHRNVNGKKRPIELQDYPHAEKYLNEHKALLAGRKYIQKAGREWFEIWVPQNPDSWAKPKLVFPDISPTPRFYFDSSGKIVNGNCYWMVAESKEQVDLLLLIQGIANSKVMTKYHDLVFGNKLYSGRRRYFSQYVQNYPLPDIRSEHARDIIQTVRLLNENDTQEPRFEVIERLENQVAKVYDLEPVLSLG